MKLFGYELTQDELRSLVGNLSQVADMKRYTFSSGRAMNMRGIDVKTGSGLNFTVLEDRGLDIASFDYKGVPFSFMAKTGLSAPWFYDPKGAGWLRNFHGGLLTTCGFINAGMESEIGGVQYGLHGRASNLPAEEVNTRVERLGDETKLIITGRIREAAVENENVSLFRTIESSVGSKSVKVTDVYTNEGYRSEPLMLLYHCNIGYPIFSPDSKLIADITHTEAFSEKFPQSVGALKDFHNVGAPDQDAKTQVFFHEIAGEGEVKVAMINQKMQMGLEISYDRRQLPKFAHARIQMPGDYFTVLEPGNCHPIGRLEESKRNGIERLEPNQSKTVDITFTVLDSEDLERNP